MPKIRSRSAESTDPKKFSLTFSKKNAERLAGNRKTVYRLPNGIYAIRKSKR